MLTTLIGNEVILVGCTDENDMETENIYKVIWPGDSSMPQWITLSKKLKYPRKSQAFWHQKLRYPRTRTVAMWIPNSLTNCNSKYLRSSNNLK